MKTENSWPEGRKYSLQGVQATVSAPVLVARSKGFLWFPTLVRMDGDNLVAVMQNRADECTRPDKTTALIARTRNGGFCVQWTDSRVAPWWISGDDVRTLQRHQKVCHGGRGVQGWTRLESPDGHCRRELQAPGPGRPVRGRNVSAQGWTSDVCLSPRQQRPLWPVLEFRRRPDLDETRCDGGTALRATEHGGH